MRAIIPIRKPVGKIRRKWAMPWPLICSAIPSTIPPITPYTPLEIDPEENPPILPPKPAEPASSDLDNAPSAEGSQEDAAESSSSGEEPSSRKVSRRMKGKKPEAGDGRQPENPTENSDEHPGVELPGGRNPARTAPTVMTCCPMRCPTSCPAISSKAGRSALPMKRPAG